MKDQILVGGDGDNITPKDVDPKELAMGLQEEKEHTDNKAIRQEISLDHLSKNDKYYTELKQIDKAAQEQIEEILKKIANTHNIENVESVILHMSSDQVFIQYKLALDLGADAGLFDTLILPQLQSIVTKYLQSGITPDQIYTKTNEITNDLYNAILPYKEQFTTGVDLWEVAYVAVKNNIDTSQMTQHMTQQLSNSNQQIA